jgi:hypothetical protein
VYDVHHDWDTELHNNHTLNFFYTFRPMSPYSSDTKRLRRTHDRAKLLRNLSERVFRTVRGYIPRARGSLPTITGKKMGREGEQLYYINRARVLFRAFGSV